MFLQRHELDEAHVRMRVGIIRMNERHGLIDLVPLPSLD
jgi:hypothetical protein